MCIIRLSPSRSDMNPLTNLPTVIPRKRQVVPSAPTSSGSPFRIVM